MANDPPNLNAEDPQAENGWRWELLDEADSTNRVEQERILADWAAGSRADGRAIIARRQTAGRGQYGRTWESPAGGLYLSLVFEDVPAELRARLALVAGMGVVEAIHEVCQLGGAGALSIRWPNDVMLEGRKLAGILCQAVAQGPRWAAIVGIGINVNTSIHDFPDMLRDEAATLASATGRAWDVEQLAHAVVASVEHWLNMTREFGIAGLVRCLAPFDALRGRGVRFESDNRVIDGIGAGMTADGSLLIRREDGTVEAFERGSVIY